MRWLATLFVVLSLFFSVGLSKSATESVGSVEQAERAEQVAQAERKAGVQVTQAQAKNLYVFCGVCHGERGEGKKDIGAPRIAGMEAWYVIDQLRKFQQGVRGTHPADMAGMRMRPMAKYLRSDAQIVAVAEYVAGLPMLKAEATLQGSWVKGERHYQLCSACHGVNGEGNVDLKAPGLVGRSDWYLLTQMHNYKAGIRGADPVRDAVGMTMRPITLILDDQAMIDVIAYINGLGQKEKK